MTSETVIETRYALPWATCGECGSERVYAIHHPREEIVRDIERLEAVCESCDSRTVSSGRKVKVQTGSYE